MDGQQTMASGLGFNPANINTLVIVDEPEENTIVYAWKGKGFKKLPFEEHVAQTAQKIRTFMTFNKVEKVTVVTINKEHLCITLTVGFIEDNALKTLGKPIKYYGSKALAAVSLKYLSKMPVDNPVLFFSLDPENFGEEIRGRVVENYDKPEKERRELEREINSHGVVGIAQDGTEKPNFFAQKMRPINGNDSLK